MAPGTAFWRLASASRIVFTCRVISAAPGAGLLGGVWAAARAFLSSPPAFTRASTLPSAGFFAAAAATDPDSAVSTRVAQTRDARICLIQLMRGSSFRPAILRDAATPHPMISARRWEDRRIDLAGPYRILTSRAALRTRRTRRDTIAALAHDPPLRHLRLHPPRPGRADGPPRLPAGGDGEAVSFEETFELPLEQPKGSPADVAAALKGMHLVLGTSYWKTCCPPRIEIEGQGLSAADAAFWTEVYNSGLGGVLLPQRARSGRARPVSRGGRGS